jgi:hypothetical protein
MHERAWTTRKTNKKALTVNTGIPLGLSEGRKQGSNLLDCVQGLNLLLSLISICRR